MKTFAQKIAWAYARGSTREQSIATMITISFASICISTCALALGVFLLHGFQDATYTALKSMNADLTIQETESPISTSCLDAIRNIPGVMAAAPTTIKYVMLKTDDAFVQTPLMLKAIDPTQEPLITNVATKILGDQKKLSVLLDDQQIVMGKKLAELLDIKPRNTVTILYPDMEEINSNRIRLDQKLVTVSGLIATGMPDLDESLLLCNQNLLDELFPNSPFSSIGIAIDPKFDTKQAQQTIHETCGLTVTPWIDLYPSLAQALQLEALGGYIVLGFLLFLSCMSITSLLFLIIMHKKRDIALLQALGTERRTIYHIFWYLGMSIAIIAQCAGLLLAILIGLFIKHSSFFTLPEIYYSSKLPIEIGAAPCLVIFVCGCLVSFIAVMIPLRSIRYITIPTVLKQEQ